MKKLIIPILLILIIPLVSAEEVFSDNFNRANNNNLGVNWTEITGASSNAEILTNQVKFTDTSTSGTGSVYIYHNYTDYLTNFNFSFDISQTTNTQYFSIELKDDNTRKIRMDLGHAGFFSNLNSTSGFQDVVAQATSTTYKINMVYYNTTHYNLCIDSNCYVLQTNDLITNGINNISFATGSTTYSSGNTYLDNFQSFNYVEGLLSVTAFDDDSNSLNEFTINLYDENSTFLATNYTASNTLTINLTNIATYNGTYYAVFNKTGYKTINQSFNYIIPNNKNIIIQTIVVPTINISFFDEETKLAVTNVSYSLFFSDVATEHDTGASNSAELDLNSTGLLEIEYLATDYYLRHYYINITPQTNTSIKLYLLNDTKTNNQLITFTITDVDGSELEGATLKLLRRYTTDSTTTFETVQMETSDINGDGGLYVQLYDATYKFIVEYNNQIILITNPEQIISNNIRLRGSLTSSIITSSIATTGLITNGVWNPATLVYTFTYTDPSSITEQVCVEITKTTGRAIQNINSSCVNGITGSIELGVPNSSGYYRVYAYQVTNTAYSDKNALNSGFTISDVKESIGISGLFYLLMFTVMGALVGLMVFQNTTGTLALTGLGFVFGVLFKVTEFGWVAGMTVVSIVGVSIWATRKLGGSGN